METLNVPINEQLSLSFNDEFPVVDADNFYDEYVETNQLHKQFLYPLANRSFNAFNNATMTYFVKI